MDYENIKKLIDDMGSSRLASLEIDFPDGTKISMKKDGNEGKASNKAVNCGETDEYVSKTEDVAIIAESIACQKESEGQYKFIKSPMVGTFYSKPSPTEKSFIEVGESIKKGSTTCIVEAMKLMNEIESEFDGEVVEILKHDGEPVEYGENLIKLK